MSSGKIFIDLSHQKNLIGQFQFEKSLLRIGRASHCDIQLNDPTLSGEHLILRFKDNDWQIEDVSQNGSLLESGETLPVRFKINKATSLRLGKTYELRFSNLPFPDQKQKTILNSQTATRLLRIEEDRIHVASAKLLRRLNDGRELIKIVDASGLSIGSHPGNDLVLDSPSASQFHARIDFIQNEFILSDLNSTNGSWLNGLRVSRAPLPSNAEIKWGDLNFQFQMDVKEISIQPKAQNEFMGMVSQSEKMKRLFSVCEVVGSTDAPVFIQGETGTGKELTARAIHNLSQRFHQPFIALNCASLPKDLIESELFGHEKGAFTGAQGNRAGAFEAAHGGTLFLDEVAELDPNLQAKLLRALESGEIKRLGSNKPIFVSVRIVSATHKDLAKEVQAGRFREDLFFRLHVVPVQLPALRDRKEDIEILIPQLLSKLNLKFSIHPDALEALQRHDFPGNVRELKNILQRAAIEYEVNLNARTRKSELNLNHFRFIEDLKFFRPVKTPTEMNERNLLLSALEESHFNQSEAARKLGIPISTFHDRMKRYGIERNRHSTQVSVA